LATRKPGFDGPITLTMLYNPPGVSTTSSVTIPAGQKEARVPLTADTSARTGTAPIVVMAQVSVDGGALLVASPLTPLEVSEPFFRFTFPTLTVEQGQTAELAIAIAKNKDFTGTAKVELLGLPLEVTSPPQEFNAAAKEIVFPLRTTANSPAGRHRSILCRAVVMMSGEPVTHQLGTGELRILKPAPAKPVEVAKSKSPARPAAAAKPVAAVKHLSRLEQLRQSRAQAAGNGEKKP